MAYQLKYEPDLEGAKAVAKTDGAQVFDGVINGGTVYSVPQDTYFVLTGYMFYDGKYTNYLQTDNGLYIYINTYEGTENNWEVVKGAFKIGTYSDSQAQALVQKIINNNKIIISNNLLCARYANRFSAAEKKQIYDLQKRLEARNNALKTDGLTKDVQSNYPAGYAELSAYLDKLMAGEGVGVAISTIAWIVVVAVIVAGAGTAAYYAYKSLADESEKDVKFSKDLTRTLVEKLTPEEYEQLLNETKGIVTKRKLKYLVSGYTGAIKFVAIAAGVYAIYKLIKERQS